METKYHVEYKLPDDGVSALDWNLLDIYSNLDSALRGVKVYIEEFSHFSKVNIRITEITKREVGMFRK